MVKVAVAQVAPVFLDKDATTAKAISVIKEAASHGAELIAFPETWIPTYPIWVQDSARWGDPVVAQSYALLQEQSVSVPGPEIALLCEAAREHSMTVVMGINERDSEYSRGTLYNSLVFIGPKGELLGVRRKLMPTHGERLYWGLGDGRGTETYQLPFGRLGGMICWEHWMPLARFAMHSLGEQIHVAAFPDLPEFHHLAARSYALEGRTFVLATGAFQKLEDVPEGFPMRDFLKSKGSEILLVGGAGVVGPDGEWITEPVFGREEIIYADLDMSRIAEEQLTLDSAGHYNRPDIFQLHVKRVPPQIVWPDAPGGGTKGLMS